MPVIFWFAIVLGLVLVGVVFLRVMKTQGGTQLGKVPDTALVGATEESATWTGGLLDSSSARAAASQPAPPDVLPPRRAEHKQRETDSSPDHRTRDPSGVGLRPRPRMDQNVQFTVFRPPAVTPSKWFALLAFAHLSQRRPDAPADEPDPVEEVQRQAQQILGDQLHEYGRLVHDSTDAVPAEGEITFLLEMAQVEFNPPRATFQWLESVHRQDFQLRAAPELVGQTARGRLTVFLGTRIIADVPLAVRVEAQIHLEPRKLEAATARPYRKVFASYSHKDLPVVQEFEHYIAAFGDRYLRDSVTLRSGEVWNDRLAEMIRDADIFQLFWSRNSMQSEYVRQEWEHALSLNRQHFVRPVYWEQPLPKDESQGLPPETLQRLHFQRLARPAAEPTGNPPPRPVAPASSDQPQRRYEWRPKAYLTRGVAPANSDQPHRGASAAPMLSGLREAANDASLRPVLERILQLTPEAMDLIGKVSSMDEPRRRAAIGDLLKTDPGILRTFGGDAADHPVKTSPLWYTRLLLPPRVLRWQSRSSGPWVIQAWPLDGGAKLFTLNVEARQVDQAIPITPARDARESAEDEPQFEWGVDLSDEIRQTIPNIALIQWAVWDRGDARNVEPLVRGVFDVQRISEVETVEIRRLRSLPDNLKGQLQFIEAFFDAGRYDSLAYYLRSRLRARGVRAPIAFVTRRALAIVYRAVFHQLNGPLGMGHPEGGWAAAISRRYAEEAYHGLGAPES